MFLTYPKELQCAANRDPIAKSTAVDDRLQGDSNGTVVVYLAGEVARNGVIRRCHPYEGRSPKRSSSPSSDNSEKVKPRVRVITPRYTLILTPHPKNNCQTARSARRAVSRRKSRVFVFTFVVIKRDE